MRGWVFGWIGSSVPPALLVCRRRLAVFTYDIYACMYVYVCVCVYTHTYRHTHRHTHTDTHTYTHTHTHTHTHTDTHTRAHTHTHVYRSQQLGRSRRPVKYRQLHIDACTVKFFYWKLLFTQGAQQETGQVSAVAHRCMGRRASQQARTPAPQIGSESIYGAAR